jgi:hypothetical protein
MWLLQTTQSSHTQDADLTPCNPFFLLINHVRYSDKDHCDQAEAAGYISLLATASSSLLHEFTLCKRANLAQSPLLAVWP